MTLQFMQQFLTDIFLNVHKIEQNNWDYKRFAPEDQQKSNFMIDQAVGWMQAVIEYKDQFERAWNMLSDDESRKLMLQILQFDILNHHHVNQRHRIRGVPSGKRQ